MADPQDYPGPGPDDDGDNVTDFTGAMNPDHPLLARAQTALKQQLMTNKQRLEEELREKKNALQVKSAV